MIFEELFPVPRYTAASKIGNSVISLLSQLRCRCNPDHNRFSSSSNTTVVAIFPKLCLWRRSLCSNLGGTDPEKLYRATLIFEKDSHDMKGHTIGFGTQSTKHYRFQNRFHNLQSTLRDGTSNGLTWSFLFFKLTLTLNTKKTHQSDFVTDYNMH